jgi:hypothetical protein
MKITQRQLQRLIKEAVDDMNNPDNGVTLSTQEAKDVVKFVSYVMGNFSNELAGGMNKQVLDRMTRMVGRIQGVIDPSGNGP